MRRWSPWSPDGHEITAPAPDRVAFRYRVFRASLSFPATWRAVPRARKRSPSPPRPSLAKQHPPVLFHKNDLAAMRRTQSRRCSAKLPTPRRLIVGIVINTAIDDSLSRAPCRSRQIGLWSISQFCARCWRRRQPPAESCCSPATTAMYSITELISAAMTAPIVIIHGKPESAGEFHLEGGQGRPALRA